jgi:hypothetical protein
MDLFAVAFLFFSAALFGSILVVGVVALVGVRNGRRERLQMKSHLQRIASHEELMPQYFRPARHRP